MLVRLHGALTVCIVRGQMTFSQGTATSDGTRWQPMQQTNDHVSNWVDSVSATATHAHGIKVAVNPPIHLDKVDLLYEVILEVSVSNFPPFRTSTLQIYGGLTLKLQQNFRIGWSYPNVRRLMEKSSQTLPPSHLFPHVPMGPMGVHHIFYFNTHPLVSFHRRSERILL